WARVGRVIASARGVGPVTRPSGSREAGLHFTYFHLAVIALTTAPAFWHNVIKVLVRIEEHFHDEKLHCRSVRNRFPAGNGGGGVCPGYRSGPDPRVG